MLGREGVCIELESDLFLVDMAAGGRGVTILTRALVPGTTGPSHGKREWGGRSENQVGSRGGGGGAVSPLAGSGARKILKNMHFLKVHCHAIR